MIFVEWLQQVCFKIYIIIVCALHASKFIHVSFAQMFAFRCLIKCHGSHKSILFASTQQRTAASWWGIPNFGKHAIYNPYWSLVSWKYWWTFTQISWILLMSQKFWLTSWYATFIPLFTGFFAPSKRWLFGLGFPNHQQYALSATFHGVQVESRDNFNAFQIFWCFCFENTYKTQGWWQSKCVFFFNEHVI